jgi:hypothetical protein
MTSYIKHTLLFSLTILLFTKCQNEKNKYTNPSNGDLNNTFNENKIQDLKISREQRIMDSLLSEGWTEAEMKNGSMPSCYNFNPKHNKSIDNYLTINVGGGTDVVVKLINIETEKAIRYVFINSSSTYKIEHIPQGKYYLKIAYGKNWISKIENNQCIGRFISSPMYEKGEDVLDYNFIKTPDGHQVPSFQLSLDVVSSNMSNSFESQYISENEFNQ